MAFLPKDVLKKNIHVVGLTGAEGAAVARFLAKESAKTVTVHDFSDADKLRQSFDTFHEGLTEKERDSVFDELTNLPFEARIGKEHYLDGIENAELVFVPQSWFRYEQNAKLQELKKQGRVPFWNITKLYVELAPCSVVGISGTSGKSTTARLLYDICKETKTTWFSGNDRLNVQMLDKLPEMKPDDVFILEVSNRQLMVDFDKPFHVAGLTNVIPSHLDDHKDFPDYVRTKQKLFVGQTSEDFSVINVDDETSTRLLPELSGAIAQFSIQKELEEGAFLSRGSMWIRWQGREYLLGEERSFQLPGPHNLANALLASMIAFLLGVDTKHIRKALAESTGIPHRLQQIRSVRGVTYFEDSSACNPDGPRMAVQSFPQPIVLMAGGSRPKENKGEFLDMMRAVVSARMRGLVVYGPIADQMKAELEEVRSEVVSAEDFPVEVAKDMREAFVKAVAVARKGDVVVLSPGCESFGEFSEYRERAEVFTKLVKDL